MFLPEFQNRLQTVRSHYRVTPWIPPQDDETPLVRSWQRCQDAGLNEADRVHFEPIARSQLAELGDRYGALVRSARPETERLAASLRGTGGAVLLCNPRGSVIDRLCDETQAPGALLTSTRIGINLAERCVGTTAPSIALTEGVPYLVGRAAHFCANLRPFFCIAAPIDSPVGERLAALDVTFYDNVPGFDIYSLTVDAALAIENSLFVARPDQMLVRFHPRPELVGTALEALLSITPDGLVTGANRAAARWLSTPRLQLIGQCFRDLFDRDPSRLFSRQTRTGLAEMQTPGGLPVAVRFDGVMAPEPVDMAGWQAARPESQGEEVVAAEPAAPSAVTQADPAAPEQPLASMRDMERRTIQAALAAHQGNISAAARQLGISRNTIYRRCRELAAE